MLFASQYSSLCVFLQSQTTYMNNKDIIGKLCTDLSARLGQTIESPSDFDRLALEIKRITGEPLSVSTIKRVFGYIDSDSNLSKSTLSILTRYLGYNGWSDYCERISGDSDFLNGYTVRSVDLPEGSRVRFAWLPNRHCIVRCIAPGRFVVEEVENARLSVGDAFNALLFSLHSPAYFSDVCHQNTPRGSGRDYVAGFRSGLTELEVMKTVCKQPLFSTFNLLRPCSTAIIIQDLLMATATSPTALLTSPYCLQRRTATLNSTKPNAMGNGLC